MMYVVHLTYMDGERLDVTLKENQIESFMDAIGKNEVFMSEESAGLWIPIDKIRFFQIRKNSDDGIGRDTEGDHPVPDESGPPEEEAS